MAASLTFVETMEQIDHADYHVGSIVPWHFTPGIIVASFASLTGTLLTVELLHRKRLGKSLMSRFQLFCCAVSMGLIGIWAMHFIGNRSIVLADGQDSLQMAYSPGYTTLSCILPIMGLTCAFYLAELPLKWGTARRTIDILSGVFAGLSIVGMHYVGNLGATNYKLIYPPRFIIAACIIAVGDCIIALALFFYFKEKWISVFWKRLGCAVLLAVAVCGMHYTASVGCTYQLKLIHPVTTAQRNTSVIVAGTLCCVAAVLTLGVLFWANRRDKVLLNRAQQVVIACAFFDQNDQVMVTNEGNFPSTKIAQRFNIQSFNEEFNASHPTFHWIWKVAHNWPSVSDLIGKMRNHIRRHNPYQHESAFSTSNQSSLYDEEAYNDSTMLFRESFCVAAQDMTDRLQGKDLSILGHLYEQVVGTGTLPTPVRKGGKSGEPSSEKAPYTFEKGQVLYFVRRLLPTEEEHFLASGYRFAPLARVETYISRTLQVSIGSLETQVQALKNFADLVNQPVEPKIGAWFVCFAMIAKVQRNFEVLVRKDEQHEIPDAMLNDIPLNNWQLNYISTFDGWTMFDFIRVVKHKDLHSSDLSQEELDMIHLLRDCLSVLHDQIGNEDWFNELIFNCRPINARYGPTSVYGNTQVFGFTRLLDIHCGVSKNSDQFAFTDLKFLSLRQQYYPGCSDQGRLRRAIHAEFGPILTKKNDSEFDDVRRGSVAHFANKQRSFLRRKRSSLSQNDSLVKPDSSSERGLVYDNENPFEPSMPPSTKGLWGGILATTDTVIVEHDQSAGSVEMKSMGPRVTATAIRDESKEESTYVDVLYQMAKSRPSLLPKPVMPRPNIGEKLASTSRPTLGLQTNSG